MRANSDGVATLQARVVVVADAALASQLSLPGVDSAAALPPHCIAYLAHAPLDGDAAIALQLFPADPRQSGPVAVDFVAAATSHRQRSGGELIVKAVQGRSRETLRVLDATAGLGRDSFVLASHGSEVLMLEREPVVAALLADGLRRAHESALAATIAARLQLRAGDALQMFADASASARPDVVYLDPMFAASGKTALAKKEMRLFQQLFTPDAVGTNDEQTLLLRARECAQLRVVVKRGAKAQPLAGIEPAYALAGKAVRFDVYPG